MVHEPSVFVPRLQANCAAAGVAPGIVVGRMQHDGLVPYRTKLNELKIRFEWTMAASG